MQSCDFDHFCDKNHKDKEEGANGNNLVRRQIGACPQNKAK